MSPAMPGSDDAAPAELFVGTWRGRARGNPVTYKRLSTSAEAIRHAVETLSPNLLAGAVLAVGEDRYGGAQIRELYERTRYP